MKKHSHMKWSWIIMVSFLVLGILDFRFGVLGFMCMGAPIYHALRGRGKVHCRSYCPRGSILGKFLPYVSLNKDMPRFMTSKWFKYFLLALMVGVFSFSLSHAHWQFNSIAMRVFRFMVMSLGVGVVTGILFKPRSWCVICPMGTATGLVAQQIQVKPVLKPAVSLKTEKKAA